MVLPNVSLDGAASVADRLRRAVESAGIPHNGTPLELGVVTISCGIASNFGSGNFDRLLSDADTALYRAKSSGRNRVERD